MEISIKNICDYLDFLIEEKHRFLTLHGDIVALPELLRYNVHLNPFCRYVKSACENGNICVRHQKKVFDCCKDHAFFGVCHAGVGEFVYPVSSKGRTVGFISVSGFKGDESSLSKALHFAEKNHLPKEAVIRVRNESLIDDIPPKGHVDTLILPLVFMLEAYIDRQGPPMPDGDGGLYVKMLNYISSNYNLNITMESLSRHFNYSVSTLSHLFKVQSGMSISDYVLKLRLDEAKRLLRHSCLPITEISESLGFCNSAYFSAVFKKKIGVPPLKYRKHAQVPISRE